MTIDKRHLNVNNPPSQRAVDDVLVRVTERGGISRVMFMSKGRADFALARYPRSTYVTGTSQPFMVERV